jgi:hypothetical protein
MTRFAFVIQHSGHVIRICRPGIIRRMARITVGIRQLIVAIDVARLTRRRDVSPRQSKLRGAVVKRRRLPQRRRMA